MGWDFASCHVDTLTLTLSFLPLLFSSPQQTLCGGGRGGGRRTTTFQPMGDSGWVLPALSQPSDNTIRSPPPRPDRQTRHPPLRVSWPPPSTVPPALTLSPEQDDSDTARYPEVKGVPSPSFRGFWPCSPVSPAPLSSLTQPCPPECPQLSACLALPLLWEGPAAPCRGLAAGSPCGAGEARLLEFPRPLASGKSALGEGTLLLASGQLLSQTKVQGRCLGTPADLSSSGSGFRPKRPREQPQVRVGTGRRHWRAVGGAPHQPTLASVPQAAEQWGGGSLDVSPLRAGCVCQAGAAWAQSPDKGPQPRRPSPVGSWWPGAERRARRVRPTLVLVLTLPGTRGRKGGAWKPFSGASVSLPGLWLMEWDKPCE